MKTPKGIREHDADELRKAKRLDPIRKSGKERHSLYRSIDEEDDENLLGTTRRESVLDYLDEGDDEEEYFPGHDRKIHNGGDYGPAYLRFTGR